MTIGFVAQKVRRSPYAAGLSPVVRRLPCACGADVVADLADPSVGVAAHNRSLAHQAWRRGLR